MFVNMQIKSIIIYNKNNQCRRLDFKLGELNIISGEQNTGKSAIIPIIDYCLGNSTLEISSGVVKDCVSFYAVLYQLTDRQVLVAKPAPSKGIFQAYYEENKEISVPTSAAVFKNKLNANNDIIIQKFSRLLGISTTKLSIRDAIPFLFQEKKSTLDNRERLFNVHFKDDVIRKSLRYFLQIYTDDNLENQSLLDELVNDFNKTKKEIHQLEKSDADKILHGRDLINNAKSISLLSSEEKTETLDDIKHILTEVINLNLQQQPLLELPEVEPNIAELEKELQELRDQLGNIDQNLTELKEFNKLSGKYSLDTKEQINRLKSIELFSSHDDLFRQGKKCPLCDSVLKNELPKASDVIKVLSKLDQDLAFVKTTENINLGKQINTLKEDKKKLFQQMNDKKSVLKNYYKEKDVLSQISKQHNEKIEIIGAIKFYLKKSFSSSEQRHLTIRKEQLEKNISLVRSKSPSSENIKITEEATFLWLSKPMSNWATKLYLEDSGSDYYFHINKLTIVANRKGVPLTMSDMQGSVNWAGCHIIALLALHKAFLERQSKIPNFIIFDQPPEEKITKILELFAEVCKELTPNLQIIVTTHARSNFDSSLIEHYWTENGYALVPRNWID